MWHNSFQFVSLFSDSSLTPLTVPTSIISNVANHLSALFVKRCSRENSMYQFFICEIFTHIQPQKIGFVLLPCGISYERLKKVRHSGLCAPFRSECQPEFYSFIDSLSVIIHFSDLSTFFYHHLKPICNIHLKDTR